MSRRYEQNEYKGIRLVLGDQRDRQEALFPGESRYDSGKNPAQHTVEPRHDVIAQSSGGSCVLAFLR